MSKIFPLLIVALLLMMTERSSAQRRVVGYYPSWSKGSYPHTAVQYQHLTHIAHTFLFPFADGSIDYSTFTSYSQLISSAHQNGVKVVISVGGWDDVRTPRFSQMASDTSARKNFVSNIVQFILTNNYDGVDIDWEYPKNVADRNNLKTLVHELRIALDATGIALSLSMAGPATSWSGQWFDFASMKNDFDWIGIMTYDFYGAWTSKAGPNSALYGNWSKNTEGWIDYSFGYYNSTRGIPKEKLLIGIPFYGQAFNASTMYGASTGGSQQTFTTIASKVGNGWTRSWDAEGQVPYLINTAATQVISYDDSQSVALKCAYVISKGSGGAIIWAIGQDKIGAKQPLLETVGSFLRTTSVDKSDPTEKIPTRIILGQNFPNPFNGQTHIRYQVRTESDVQIQLFNLLGQSVKILADGKHAAGVYEVTVSSDGLPSGVYFYRLLHTTTTLTRSMTVIR